MDIIFLSELKVDTVIGIWEWERRIRQTVIIDLEMSADIATAAATDSVEDTLNYKQVAKRVQSFVADSSFQLVETLAERIAGIIREEFGVSWVKVRVNKPGAIRGSKAVGVLIERGQRGQLMAKVFLGLGSNIAPERNLRLAIRELAARYGRLALSPVYRSAAVGFSGADFMNLVVRLESDQSPLDICRTSELIHNLSGRSRGSDKWASRPLDIDLLLYNDLIEDQRPVRVPRDDILEYSFVLRPMADLAPDLVHPQTGKTMRQHWQEFDAASHPLHVVDFDWQGLSDIE